MFSYYPGGYFRYQSFRLGKAVGLIYSNNIIIIYNIIIIISNKIIVYRVDSILFYLFIIFITLV